LYPRIPFGVKDIPALLDYIRADKKNQSNAPLFSLAFAPGKCQYNIEILPETVVQVLNKPIDDSH
jgi:3-dehydroquinate synthetase